MAQVIRCDVCEEEAAVAVMTMVQTGDVQGIGSRCLAAWAHGLWEALTSNHPSTGDMSDVGSSGPHLAAVANLSDLTGPSDSLAVESDGDAPPARPATKPRAPRRAAT